MRVDHLQYKKNYKYINYNYNKNYIYIIYRVMLIDIFYATKDNLSFFFFFWEKTKDNLSSYVN